MKKFVSLFVLIISFCGYAQEQKNYETVGNLESENPCGCVELSEVTNKHTPMDILMGMKACLDKEDYNKAAKLFAIAGVFGRFDTYRVSDKSAHQAIQVRNQSLLMNLEERAQKELISNFELEFNQGTENLVKNCTIIQKIGMPDYYPKYMIQHGMKAFINTGTDDDGLVADFDSEASWQKALESYLHCGE